MDASEATKIVMSRIKNLDPENASKIMGYTLIQDQGDKEMIRLAFSPDTLLLSHVDRAKARLGLSSNTPFSQKFLVANNGFHLTNPRPLSVGNNSVGSPGLHFYGGSDFGEELLFPDGGPAVDPILSPSGRSDSLVFPYDEDAACITSPHPYRRSFSVNDAAFLEEGGRPCLYFARGFCKNGSSCKFLHSDEGIEEILRMKMVQQQRFALMGSASHHPFGYTKGFNGNLRSDLSMGLGAGPSSSSRQIYLTFPADSTFKEEDVSNYFSMFGPVQDVRIPYQQKRMFGFVTFVYPETVKLILAKGNPHFLCDCRVLVKPYKEKGKVGEKKQQHQSENFEFPFGPRMAMNSQDGPITSKLEDAIEVQGRKMMNLRLENHSHTPSFMQSFPCSSPRLMNSDSVNQHDAEDGVQEGTESSLDNNINVGNQLHQPNTNGSDLPVSIEKKLPDNVFTRSDKGSMGASKWESC